MDKYILWLLLYIFLILLSIGFAFFNTIKLKKYMLEEKNKAFKHRDNTITTNKMYQKMFKI